MADPVATQWVFGARCLPMRCGAWWPHATPLTRPPLHRRNFWDKDCDRECQRGDDFMAWYMVTLQHEFSGANARNSLIGKQVPLLTDPVFGPLFCVVEIGGCAGLPGPFLTAAVHLCNHGVPHSVACTVVAPSSVNQRASQSSPSALETAIQELKFGCIGINTWSGHCAMLAEGTWGAHPGEDVRLPRSGRGHSGNGLLIDDPEKTVVWSPVFHAHHMWPEKVTTIAAAENLVNYIVKPGVLSTIETSLPLGGCNMGSRGELHSGRGSDNCTVC